MLEMPLLMLHICSAIVGLLSGFMAIVLRKGSSWHGAAGTVFFVSMISMSTTAVWIATVYRPLALNVIAGSLTFYLVTTAWRAAKNRVARVNAFDVGACLFILAVGLYGWSNGLSAKTTPGQRGYLPIYFIFGSVALLFSVADVRMLLRGGAVGAQRIGRHLWRMSLALLITTLSFYPGQGKLFSKAVRSTNLLFVPHILVAGIALLWLYRISVRKRAERRNAILARQPETIPGAATVS